VNATLGKEMIAYHFLNEKYGLDALKNERLKISRLNELNDPFEFFHINSNNFGTRQILNRRKNHYNNRYGIICFSRNFSNPVQWAHYANSHKGICLAFEVSEKNLININYLENKHHGNTFKDSLDFKGEEFVKFMLSHKFNHWSYEQESRVLIDLTTKDNENGLLFENFSTDLKLVGIILGCRSTLSIKGIKKIKNCLYSNTNIFKVQPSSGEFLMEKYSEF
jgi:hypothetical protein